MDKMTDARAVEVLAAMRDDGGVVADADYTAAIDHAIARLREPVGGPAGWLLVPREPSIGMWDSAETAMIESECAYNAGEQAARSDAHGFPTMRIWQAVVGYRAMLAAAQQPAADDVWAQHPQTVESKRQWDAVAKALGADPDCPDAVLAAAQAKPASAWQAIVEACVVTEAVTPDAADPRGTLHRLIDYHVALDRDQQPAAVDGASEAMAAIGHLIATQDNRITASPIFIVQQKRLYAADPECDYDRLVWVDGDGEAGAEDAARLDAEYAETGIEPAGWRRAAEAHYWDFVTACFTEQGCKEYIARDGHNLREPRIYAAGSYRNAEWQAVRSYLIALAAQPGGSDNDR